LNVTAFQPLWTKELPSLEVFIMAICIIKWRMTVFLQFSLDFVGEQEGWQEMFLKNSAKFARIVLYYVYRDIFPLYKAWNNQNLVLLMWIRAKFFSQTAKYFSKKFKKYPTCRSYWPVLLI
jgi:Ser/Thr protein kinase RdoA (MazF antagonist)